MSRKNLEETFKAIKDIKSEKYAGTRDILDYLRIRDNFREAPIKIAHSINHNLRQELNTPTLQYAATPENVIGLLNKLDKLWQDLEHRLITERNEINLSDNPEDFFDYKFEDSFYISSVAPTITSSNLAIMQASYECYENEEERRSLTLERTRYAVEWLTHLFLENQKPGSDNYTLGGNATKKIIEELRDKDSDERVIWKIGKMLEDIQIDWNRELSKENADEIEKEFDSFNYRESLSPTIEKVMRDKLDKKLEYRREIITDWLLFTGVKSYEHACSILEDEINDLSKRSEGRSVGYLENIIDRTRMLKLLKSDRNFVTRFLRN